MNQYCGDFRPSGGMGTASQTKSRRINESFPVISAPVAGWAPSQTQSRGINESIPVISAPVAGWAPSQTQSQPGSAPGHQPAEQCRVRPSDRRDGHRASQPGHAAGTRGSIEFNCHHIYMYAPSQYIFIAYVGQSF